MPYGHGAAELMKYFIIGSVFFFSCHKIIAAEIPTNKLNRNTQTTEAHSPKGIDKMKSVELLPKSWNVVKKVGVILAHPDDETWVSGSLARLAKEGKQVVVVYLTSGGAGKDRSSKNLQGKTLAYEREKESQKALKVLNTGTEPIFLRLPDSDLRGHMDIASKALTRALSHNAFDWLLTFEAKGITGHDDHQVANSLTLSVARQLTNKPKVFAFSVSRSRASKLLQVSTDLGLPYYVRNPINDKSITFIIDVQDYAEQRIEAMQVYETQFPTQLMKIWEKFVNVSGVEEWVEERLSP